MTEPHTIKTLDNGQIWITQDGPEKFSVWQQIHFNGKPSGSPTLYGIYHDIDAATYYAEELVTPVHPLGAEAAQG